MSYSRSVFGIVFVLIMLAGFTSVSFSEYVDFDGDGTWNILPVSFHPYDGTFTVTFIPVPNFPDWAEQLGARAVAGDFNGDGRDDIALTGGTGWNTLPVAFSNGSFSGGSGGFTVTNLPLAFFPSAAQQLGARPVAGDFDGDGKDDIALTGQTGNTIPVAFSNGDGRFTVTYQPVAGFPGWAHSIGVQAVSGDFDGDGKDDIALTGGDRWQTLPVAFSNGDGTFTVTNQPLVGFPSWAHSVGARAVAGDFNGDGRDDIALTGGTGWNTLPVAFSNGDGTFTVTNLPLVGFSSVAQQLGARPVAGDFNNDGRDDIALIGIALIGGFDWTLPVAFSDGDGTFTDTYQPSRFQTWANLPGARAVVGDFDASGSDDIALIGNSFGFDINNGCCFLIPIALSDSGNSSGIIA